jgi:hypothetical protein
MRPLAKNAPAAMNRFFRSEVIDRWNVDPDKAACLDGSRDQLVAFLRDHYDFSVRRARIEVDEFLCVFDEKLRRAIGVSRQTGAA